MTEVRIKGRTFNYRIGTKKYDENDRWFDIIEVYYTDGIPTDYVEDTRVCYRCESVAAIKEHNALLIQAYFKPIIDLDDFPNEFTETIDS